MVIVLETDVKLGDVVIKKVDAEKNQLMVTGFIIHAVDSAGQVIHYSVLCSDNAGNILDYKAYEIEQFQPTY